jgi:DNA-binding NarL/FixJ family response regulator
MSTLEATHRLPLQTRVLLADEPGFSRTALARVLTETPGIDVVEVDRRGLRDALGRFSPDVLVIDDRLLRNRRRLPGAVGMRSIVVGVDDDPAYALRAADVGAAAWLPKERADLLIRAIFDGRRAVVKY